MKLSQRLALVFTSLSLITSCGVVTVNAATPSVQCPNFSITPSENGVGFWIVIDRVGTYIVKNTNNTRPSSQSIQVELESARNIKLWTGRDEAPITTQFQDLIIRSSNKQPLNSPVEITSVEGEPSVQLRVEQESLAEGVQVYLRSRNDLKCL